MIAPYHFIILHRGNPPTTTPDPWAETGATRVGQLARAIATSDTWAARAPAVLAVRANADPIIAAIGRFNDADRSWLAIASKQLEVEVRRVHWLDHEASVAAVEHLANALTARFGRRDLRSFRYASVPRGGLIVLGVLAYMLDLPRARIASVSGDPSSCVHDPTSDGTPLVIVDDIAISGLRLSQAVIQRSESSLIVATLHAHPDLRSAFVASHPRVEAFVAAHDLNDFAAAELGDAYAAWRHRWRERATPGSLWIGRPEHVAYPWNEPDIGVWNPVTEREEPGFSLVPPERCIKRRRTDAIPVQIMSPGAGPWRPHPDVLAATFDDQVVIGHLGTGATFELEGSAARFWRELTVVGDPDVAAARVAENHAVDPVQVTEDLTAFMADLLAAGLLVEADA